MKYTTKKCPYCKTIYENYSSITEGAHLGSPLITCKKCKKIFIDKEMEELALKPFSELKKKYSMLRLMSSLWNIFTFVFILFSYMIFSGNLKFDSSFESIFMLVLYCGCGIFTLSIIKSITIDRQKIIDGYKQEYAKSEIRLSDPHYALALKQAGYSVPEKYLKFDMETSISNESMNNQSPDEIQITEANNSDNSDTIDQIKDTKVKIKVKRKNNKE
ncbi:MAG: hypothetical protein IJ362_09820 [Oscillospiraceae bacterium]|nr:hypothetical protein [Oscillospiraceae bacterium]